MTKLTKVLFFNIAAMMIFALAGCSSTTPTNTAANAKPAENKATTAPAENKAATTAPADNKAADAKTETASADSIGVPECDEYIKKYEACVMSKVPEAMRATFKNSLDQSRTAWKAAAANPQSKATLGAACKQAHETAKSSLAAYSCEW